MFVKTHLTAWIFFTSVALICNPIHSQEFKVIADKIWKNECGQTINGLTSWNKGENFASLGIGHFIWYPSGTSERFQETFPDLLQFFQKEGVVLPPWLSQAQGCPWSSREEFYLKSQSTEMKSLRQLLYDTRDLQATFMANRLENVIQQMQETLPEKDRDHISTIYHRLKNDPRGLYALIDYLNFKGSGISTSEAYKGQGWGLLQVLKGISLSSTNIVGDFVDRSKHVLAERVKNAPKDRNEERWLKGWYNRLDTYLLPP